MASEETEKVPPASERLATDYERRAPVSTLIAIGVVASALGIALGLLIDWFPVSATTQAGPIDTLYDVLIVASVPVFVLVMTVVLYCVWRFRMRPGEELKDGPPVHGNTRLEVIWTLIPALLMLGLSTYAYVILRDIEEAPAAAQEELNVRVVGEQFTWTFYYPNEGGEEIASSTLALPVDRSVKFTIQSKDVLHDFWVPAFRMKLDAVPGLDTSYRVTPTREGRFPVVCAELCGIGHAVMRQTAEVMPAEEFEAWFAERAEGGPAAGGGDEQAGEDVDGKALYASAGCGSCHVLADAGTTGDVGPDLDEFLAEKDAAYIRESIVEPDAQVAAGYSPGIMPPNYEETLSPEQIDALTDYLLEVTR